MRIFFSLIITVFAFIQLDAQIYNPVKWKTDYKAISATEYDLIFIAEIEDGWTIYSQFLESEDGPVASTFNFDDGDHFAVDGKTKESDKNRISGFDKIFEMNVVKFKKIANFTQRVKVTDISKPITGYVNFMTCDATKCLPPSDYDFKFELKAFAGDGKSSGNNGATETGNPANNVVDKAKEQIKQQVPLPVPIPESPKVKTTTKPKVEQTTPNKNKTNTKVETTKKKIVEKAEEASQSANNTIQSTGKSSGILNPVSWTTTAKKINDKEFELVLSAKVQEGWTIYSQFLEGEDGPVPTTITFDDSKAFETVGKTKEAGPKRIAGFDKVFEMDVVKFKKSVDFTQKLKINDPNKPVSGFIEFMTCDATKCLPPAEVDFHFTPATMKALVGDEAAKLNAAASGDSDTGAVPVAPAKSSGPFPAAVANVDLDNPVASCGPVKETVNKNSSLWSIFVLGFFGGLLALLTPCVFPMIPLTVSFFTKGSENRSKGLFNAFMYGAFILLVYLLLSIPFHLMDSLNPDILNEISTNIYLNIAFFVIFLFFAFSFFGYYELALPASWTNKASSAEGAGGIVGIFFMALTLALVSFSCTGPILGSLLAGALSSDGGAWQLTSGMAGFGFALALPFALFAAFPSWMNSLPKSGGWLTTVKVVLGFLELALAFKFLSNADLVKHWGLLKIEPFLIIWIIIFAALGLYLFGKIKFPHDSPIKKLSPIRMGLGVASFAFAFYLMSGFRYSDQTKSFTSLTLLSGLAPPVGYSWIYPKECPNNLDCFKDFDSGLAYAQEKNKPIMIDFTGHACVNCRKMEENVWNKKEVIKYLKDDYVLISLYVDEKIDLPEGEQEILEKATGKTRLSTYGKKWSVFQTEYFNNNSQPYYVLLSPDGKLLNNPVGYTPEVGEYTNFLECGLKAYEKVKDKQLLGAVD